MPYMRKAVDAPFGAMPYGGVMRIGAYHKDASASAIYPGDFVIYEVDGAIAAAASDSTQIIGVAAEYSAASTAKADFLVYDHPDQLFMIQDDSDTTHMAATEVAANTFLITTTGDTTTLRSKHEIDSSLVNTTATMPVKIVELHPIEDGSYAAAAGSPRKWIVKINSHVLGGGTGMTGITT